MSRHPIRRGRKNEINHSSGLIFQKGQGLCGAGTSCYRQPTPTVASPSVSNAAPKGVLYLAASQLGICSILVTKPGSPVSFHNGLWLSVLTATKETSCPEDLKLIRSLLF